MAIRNLTETATIAAGDYVAVSVSGNDRKITITTLMTFLAGLISAPVDKVIQFESPVTGFSVDIEPPVEGNSMWLVLTPTGTLATGTIILPVSGDATDGQEVLVCSSQTITALTVSATGLTVTGAPTTLAAGGSFLMKFDSVNSTWRRVG
jgi:hypothetical protein